MGALGLWGGAELGRLGSPGWPHSHPLHPRLWTLGPHQQPGSWGAEQRFWVQTGCVAEHRMSAYADEGAECFLE